MQRGLFVVGGAGVVAFGCFLVLKRAVSTGLMVTDVVMAATAATLVLAALSAVLSTWAVISARQARAETARLARSLEATFRKPQAAVLPVTKAGEKLKATLPAKRPYLIHGDAAQIAPGLRGDGKLPRPGRPSPLRA